MASPRIIAGRYKGLHLNAVPGSITRPITDRVKEALFNVIGADIVDAYFLDVFGGTGSVGIEALSRGAAFVTFIEKNRIAFQVLQKNLRLTKEPDKYKLIFGDAFSVVEREISKGFDYIFIAPPQYKGMWVEMLLKMDTNLKLLNENAWVIVQIDPKEYKIQQLSELKEFDIRDYGSTRLIFYIKN
ncbi:MAG: 16S rRNA (guanine(966)-N(2))-methyltransferase RsmD [Chloroflexi bacterium]|nr:16S rRNA (guanine(966)-N(2))-methyltransferase RsmD [Chloroflexota bacterium]